MRSNVVRRGLTASVFFCTKSRMHAMQSDTTSQVDAYNKAVALTTQSIDAAINSKDITTAQRTQLEDAAQRIIGSVHGINMGEVGKVKAQTNIISPEVAMREAVSEILRLPSDMQVKIDTGALSNIYTDFLGADANVKGQAYTQAAQSVVQAIDQVSGMAEVSGEVKVRLAELKQEIAAYAADVLKLTKGKKSAPKESGVKYYRVQGGTLPKASMSRIKIDTNGKIIIPNKKANLNISIGNIEHAVYFKNKRGAGAVIIELEVPKWFNDFMVENAIEQNGYKTNPLNQGGTAPKLVDKSTPGKSYELAPPWIECMEEYETNGRKIY